MRNARSRLCSKSHLLNPERVVRVDVDVDVAKVGAAVVLVGAVHPVIVAAAASQGSQPRLERDQGPPRQLTRRGSLRYVDGDWASCGGDLVEQVSSEMTQRKIPMFVIKGLYF